MNQYLPEIPTEVEISKQGQDLSEMNKLLLKKVEELTLYLIEKDRQVNELEKRMLTLEPKPKNNLLSFDQKEQTVDGSGSKDKGARSEYRKAG